MASEAAVMSPPRATVTEWIRVWAHEMQDYERERMDFAKTLEAVQDLSRRWPQANWKLVEDAANGPAVISALQMKVRGLVPVKPQGGKLSRAQAILPLVAAGNVWLPSPQEQPWVEEFLAEAQSFPVGAHDDQMDAMSQGLQRFLTARDPAVKVRDERPQFVKDIEAQAKRMMRGYSDRGPMVRPSEWK